MDLEVIKSKVGVHVICNRKEGYVDIPLPEYSREMAYRFLDYNDNIGRVVALFIIKFKPCWYNS